MPELGEIRPALRIIPLNKKKDEQKKQPGQDKSEKDDTKPEPKGENKGKVDEYI